MKLWGLLVGYVAWAVSVSAAEPLRWDYSPVASKIDFAVHATGDSFVGHLQRWNAQFQAESGSTPTAGSLTFALSDLKTGKADRDQQMLAWLDAKQFPNATFVLRSLLAANGQWTATGDFTFHGVTRPLFFPIQFSPADSRRNIDGAVTVDTRAWNLKVFHKFGILKVDPLVKVTFHLEAAAR